MHLPPQQAGSPGRPPARSGVLGVGWGSGFTARKAHGGGASAVVGLDVDKADHALLDLVPSALQGRADALGLFYIFGIAAQGLSHLVVPRVAEVAAGLVAFGVGGPAAIEADYAQ